MITQPINERDGGFALIVVLGFLFVVTLLTTPFATQARTSFLISANSQQLDRMSMLAEGLMEVVGGIILSNHEAEDLPFKLNGEKKSCITDRYVFSVSTQDHRGMIDLNSAGRNLLMFGFETLGVDRITADRLAQTVIHLRSIEFGSAPVGVFSTNTKRKFGRFASTLELMDIDSEHRLNHRSIGEVFTVHTSASRFIDELAPLRLKKALETNVFSDLPISPQPGARFVNGVYTISVSIRQTNGKLVKNLVKISAIGIHDGRPVQHIETIPKDVVHHTRPTTTASCVDLFGPSVAKILAEI